MSSSMDKALSGMGVDMKPLPLTPDQTQIVMLSLLQRLDLTHIEKSAVLIGLISFNKLKKQLGGE